MKDAIRKIVVYLVLAAFIASVFIDSRLLVGTSLVVMGVLVMFYGKGLTGGGDDGDDGSDPGDAYWRRARFTRTDPKKPKDESSEFSAA